MNQKVLQYFGIYLEESKSFAVFGNVRHNSAVPDAFAKIV